MIGLMGKIFGTRVLVILVLTMGAGLLALWFTVQWQGDRLEKSRDQINGLSRQIEAMKSAAALTEALRKDNAILEQELDDLRTEIGNAQGAATPLPDDIKRIVRRVQRGPAD